MRAEQPDIAAARDGRNRRLGGEFVGGVVVTGAFVVLFGFGERVVIEQAGDFLVGEAGQVHVVVGGGKRGDLGGEQILIPAGVERQAVVRQHVRAPLCGRQAREHDDRHLPHAERLRGAHAAVAGDDFAIRRGQHRIGEPELGNRRLQLGDLRRRMRARISGIRHQALDRPHLHARIGPGIHAATSPQALPPTRYPGTR